MNPPQKNGIQRGRGTCKEKGILLEITTGKLSKQTGDEESPNSSEEENKSETVSEKASSEEKNLRKL